MMISCKAGQHGSGIVGGVQCWLVFGRRSFSASRKDVAAGTVIWHGYPMNLFIQLAVELRELVFGRQS